MKNQGESDPLVQVPRFPGLLDSYSLEPHLAETEFLRRELGLEWITIGEQDLLASIWNRHRRGQRTILICSNLDRAEKTISLSPDDSILLVLLSDEDCGASVRTLRNHAVARIFRQYSIIGAPPRSILECYRGFLSDLIKSGNASRELFSVAVDFLVFIRNRSRSWRWRCIREKCISIPLGYTSKFCRSFLAIRNHENYKGSLLSLSSVKQPTARVGICFSGNQGSLQRRAGLRLVASSTQPVTIRTAEFWMGFESEENAYDLEYVKELANSAFVACPPGFSANESFREMEALVSGAVPFGVKFSARHPTERASMMGSKRFFDSNSFSESVIAVDELGERERKTYLKEALAETQVEIATLRARIWEMIEVRKLR